MALIKKLGLEDWENQIGLGDRVALDAAIGATDEDVVSALVLDLCTEQDDRHRLLKAIGAIGLA
jgi:hypothetical protein